MSAGYEVTRKYGACPPTSRSTGDDYGNSRIEMPVDEADDLIDLLVAGPFIVGDRYLQILKSSICDLPVGHHDEICVWMRQAHDGSDTLGV